MQSYLSGFADRRLSECQGPATKNSSSYLISNCTPKNSGSLEGEHGLRFKRRLSSDLQFGYYLPRSLERHFLKFSVSREVRLVRMLPRVLRFRRSETKVKVEPLQLFSLKVVDFD